MVDLLADHEIRHMGKEYILTVGGREYSVRSDRVYANIVDIAELLVEPSRKEDVPNTDIIKRTVWNL